MLTVRMQNGLKKLKQFDLDLKQSVGKSPQLDSVARMRVEENTITTFSTALREGDARKQSLLALPWQTLPTNLWKSVTERQKRNKNQSKGFVWLGNKQWPHWRHRMLKFKELWNFRVDFRNLRRTVMLVYMKTQVKKSGHVLLQRSVAEV